MNVLGECVKVLVDGFNPAGNYIEHFNSNYGSSGLYFYTLTVYSGNGKQNYSVTKKMILLK